MKRVVGMKGVPDRESETKKRPREKFREEVIARGNPPIGSMLHSDSVFPCDPPRGKGRDRKGGDRCPAKERCADTTPTVSIAHVLRERLGAEFLGAAP
jgi:hypothetical protein